jgi:hypothetical protein
MTLCVDHEILSLGTEGRKALQVGPVCSLLLKPPPPPLDWLYFYSPPPREAIDRGLEGSAPKKLIATELISFPTSVRP